MAKRTKSKLEPTLYHNSKLDKSLLLSAKFTYEVEVYRLSNNAYGIEDSKFISADKWIADSTEVVTKGDVRFKRLQRLIAAPEKWLIENNYTKT